MPLIDADDMPDRHRELVRDLGPIEQVYVEWMEDQLNFCTIYVEEAGEERRALALESNELSRLIEVLEQAEADMAATEDDAYVDTE